MALYWLYIVLLCCIISSWQLPFILLICLCFLFWLFSYPCSNCPPLYVTSLMHDQASCSILNATNLKERDICLSPLIERFLPSHVRVPCSRFLLIEKIEWINLLPGKYLCIVHRWFLFCLYMFGYRIVQLRVPNGF